MLSICLCVCLFPSVEAQPIMPIPVPVVVSKYLDDPDFTHADTLSLAKMRSTVSKAMTHRCGLWAGHQWVGCGCGYHLSSLYSAFITAALLGKLGTSLLSTMEQ